MQKEAAIAALVSDTDLHSRAQMLFFIREGDLADSRVIALLQQHLDEMHKLSPPESVHALDLQALQAPEVSFWCAWSGEDLAACAALKQLGATHGEIKTMRTADTYRRQGLAAMMLEYLLAQAGERAYQRLSLETGVEPGFEAARQLYRRFGFVECPPFADYKPDPNSVFMTLQLPGAAQA